MNYNNLHTINVLLVEDSPADQELMRRALFSEKKDFANLTIVSDGEEALSYLKRSGSFCDSNHKLPDLILLDLNLPKYSGDEVLSYIKSDDSLKHIPVIVLTTSSCTEDVTRSYQLGCNTYITKPIDFEHFTRVVETIHKFWFKLVTLPKAPV